MEDDTVTITQVCPDKNIVKVFISTNHVDKHCLHFSIGVIDDGGRAYIVEIHYYSPNVLIPISDYMTKQTDIDKMKNRRADLEKTKLGCETICYDIERHLRLLGVNDVDLCLSDCDDQETDDEEYDSVMFLRRSLQTNKVLLKEATDVLLDCEREFDEAEDMFIAPCDITSMSLTGSESRSATIMVSSTEKVVLLNYRAGMPAPLSKLSRLKCTIFRGATKAISVACDLGVAFCIDIHGNLRSRQFPPHGDLGAGLGRTVTPACPADEFHEVTLGVHGIGKICKAISSNRDYALALSESGDVWGWGNGVNGCLGDSSMGTLHELPRMIISDKNVVQIATGEKQCVAQTADGRVLSAGISGMGRLDSQVTLGEQHSFLEMNNDAYMKSRQDGMTPSFLTTCCNHTCVIFAASSCIDEVSKFSVEVAQDRGPIEKSSLSLLEVNIRLTAAHRALLHSQSSLDVRHVLNRASFENVIDRVNTLICEMESITVPTPTPELASGGKAAKRRRAASSSKY